MSGSAEIGACAAVDTHQDADADADKRKPVHGQRAGCGIAHRGHEIFIRLWNFLGSCDLGQLSKLRSQQAATCLALLQVRFDGLHVVCSGALGPLRPAACMSSRRDLSACCQGPMRARVHLAPDLHRCSQLPRSSCAQGGARRLRALMCETFMMHSAMSGLHSSISMSDLTSSNRRNRVRIWPARSSTYGSSYNRHLLLTYASRA